MDLHCHGYISVGEARDQGDVPQGPVSRQWLGMDLTHEVVEFSASSRWRQAHLANMAVNGELRVLDPERVVKVQGDRHRAPAKRGEEVQTPLELVDEALAIQGALFSTDVENRHLGRVHVGVRRLGVQHAGIETGHPFHRSPLSARHATAPSPGGPAGLDRDRLPHISPTGEALPSARRLLKSFDVDALSRAGLGSIDDRR
jgi:hypothetical protein